MGSLRQSALLVVTGLTSLTSCRFQDLTPGSSRRDEIALQSAAAAFYQALSLRDVRAVERTTLPAATVLIATDPGMAVLVPMRALIDVPDRRNQGSGARVTRGELRIDGDVATDRVTVVARAADGVHDFEATDVLTLAHRTSGWSVAHAVFGRWHARSAA